MHFPWGRWTMHCVDAKAKLPGYKRAGIKAKRNHGDVENRRGAQDATLSSLSHVYDFADSWVILI